MQTNFPSDVDSVAVPRHVLRLQIFSMNRPNVSLIIVVSPVIFFFLYYLLSLCAQFYKFPLQLSLLVPSLYIRANSNIGADFELIFYRLRISLLHTLSPTHSLPQF